MVRVAVIDNGGQYTHRIMRSFQDFGAEAEIIANTTPIEEIQAEGMAFSGSGLRMGLDETDPMGNCGLYLDKFEGPIMGICAGHQYIAMHFGGDSGPAKTPEFGTVEVLLDSEDEVLKGFPEKFTAWVSHNDGITKLPGNFTALAHSANCKYEVIRHNTKPIFGFQIHPEVQHTEHRELIFKNFLELCGKN